MAKRPTLDLAAAMEADLRAHDPESSGAHPPTGPLSHGRLGSPDHDDLEQSVHEPMDRKSHGTTGVAPSRIGMKRVQGYFSPRVKRQLRVLAAELDLTEEALVGKALNLLFEANRLPAIAFDGKEPPESGAG